MPRPKRNVLATAEETFTPPDVLPEGHVIAQVVKAAGNNLYSVKLASGKLALVELPSRFRSTIWIRRRGYVVVDTKAFDDRDNKLDGEIVNVVRDEKEWRKMPYWPEQFKKSSTYLESSDDEDSTVGKMPPAEDSDDEN